MKKLKLREKNGNIIRVELKIGYYEGNKTNIKIGLITYDENGAAEDYGNMTVNLGDRLMPYYAYIDINGIPSLPKFLEKYGMAEHAGCEKMSGYVKYPMYRFNRDKLCELDSIGTFIFEKGCNFNKELYYESKNE